MDLRDGKERFLARSVDDLLENWKRVLVDRRPSLVARGVWLLLDAAWDDGHQLSVGELIWLSGLGEDVVRRALRQLEEWDYLVVTRRPGRPSLFETKLPDATLFDPPQKQGGSTRVRDIAGKDFTKLASLASSDHGKDEQQPQEQKQEKLGTSDLIRWFISEAGERGVSRPLDRWLAQLGRYTKQALAGGRSDAQIKAGMRRMLDRGVMQPAMLDSFILEAEATKGKSSAGLYQQMRERGES